MQHWKLAVPWLAFAALSAAQNAKLAPELQGVNSSEPLSLIVEYTHAPTAADHNKVISRGGALHRQLNSVAGGAYSLPASALNDLANDASVAHISLDHAIQARLDYAVAATNAAVAQTWGYTGAGVGVAVIDSGIAANADFGNRVVATLDFTGGGGQDLFGHGTHVAGIIGGDGANSHCPTCTRNLRGMAPGVNLLNFRVLDQNGLSSDSSVIAALEAAISLKSQYNIRVINLSLGRPVFESYKKDPLCQAVEAAWKAGIVVVVAAGNDGRLNLAGNFGYGTINAPGNDPYALTVGAMKTEGTYDRGDDQLASYSSKGPSLIDNIAKPDIVAPGNRIVSVLANPQATLAVSVPANVVRVNYYDSNGSASTKSPYYMSLSGTSMAAAVTSGAVADLLQAQPWLTPDQVKARLMLTAYKVLPAVTVAYDATTGQSYTDYYDLLSRGAGYLDLVAAIQSNVSSSGSALSPVVQFNSLFHMVNLQCDLLSAWNLAGLFGALAPANVWGSSALGVGNQVITSQTSAVGTVSAASSPSASSAAWGTSAAWNTSAAWGTSAIWGTSAAWATSTTSAASAVWATSAAQALIGEK